MTDYPIPDELRDKFSVEWGKAYYQDDDDEPDQVIVVVMDRLTRHGFHIELRLPEFVVHNDTCCSGTGEVCTFNDSRHVKPYGICRTKHPDRIVPCPGVGYYHWTVSE